MEEKRILNDAVAVVKEQGYAMRQAMSQGNIRDVLKFSSALLSELRSSTLSPRAYFELYLAVSSELSVLYEFFREPSKRKRRISDLYETIQLAGNVLPRLYLLATIGSVCIRERAGSITEYLDDMTALGAGIQHPTRGLLYRYYIITTTKKHLPDCGDVEYKDWSEVVEDGTVTNAEISFNFILTNLVEACRLWARLNFQPLPADKTKRDRERLALRPLLKSMLDVMTEFKWFSDFAFLGKIVIPRLMASVAAMRDPQAQQYMFGSLIELVSPDILLRTAERYFAALSSLNATVDLKVLYDMILRKLRKHSDEACCVRSQSVVSVAQVAPLAECGVPNHTPSPDGEIGVAPSEKGSPQQYKRLLDSHQTEGEDAHLQSLTTEAPSTVKIDPVISVYRSAREALMDLIQKSYEQDFLPLTTAKGTLPYHLHIADLLSMIHSLTLFSLCTPLIETPHYVEGALHLLVPLTSFIPTMPEDCHSHLWTLIVQIMVEPFCSSAQLSLLTTSDFKTVWSSLPPALQKHFARLVCRSVTRHQCSIKSLAVLSALLELSLLPIRRQPPGAKAQACEWHADASAAAALTHLVNITSPVEEAYTALVILQDAFTDHPSPEIRRYAGPALLHRLLALLQSNEAACTSAAIELPHLVEGRIKSICLNWMKSGIFQSKDDAADLRCPTEFLFREVLRCAAELASIALDSRFNGPSASVTPDGQIDDNTVLTLLKEALVQFEEELSDTKKKHSSLLLLVKFLSVNSKALPTEDCSLMASRITKYTSKLLRSSEQAQVILQCTHMFWETAIEDPKKCTECLQRALQLAHAAANFEPRDTGLFIDVLEKYLFFRERQIVTDEAFSSLLTLCKEHLEFASQSGAVTHNANPICHYKNIVAKLQRCGDFSTNAMEYI